MRPFPFLAVIRWINGFEAFDPSSLHAAADTAIGHATQLGVVLPTTVRAASILTEGQTRKTSQRLELWRRIIHPASLHFSADAHVPGQGCY